MITFIQGCNSDYDNNNTLPATAIVSNDERSSCDVVLDKQYYQICYDYGLKGALFVSYVLSGDKVNSLNIDTRPSFYQDTSLPIEYVSKKSDYTGSGYDRGHLANDASFDYSDASLISTYVMSNIIPQEPSVNRYAWIDTEDEERNLAKEYGEVGVIIGVVYNDTPQRIGSDDIAIPTAFYKTIYNASGYQVCYYYDNLPILDVSMDKLKDHEVDCSTLTLQYEGMLNISLNTIIKSTATSNTNNTTTVNKPTTSTPSTPSYSCQTSKTCGNMSSCEEAYFYLGSCGFSKLDRDKDGVPCESICN